jgi:hypothetical protein
MDGMYKYKNAKITPAKNGYIVTYDKYTKGKDNYEGMSYHGECKEIAKTGVEAIKIMDKITKGEYYSPSLKDYSEASEPIKG